MTQAAKLAALGSAGVATGFKNRIINGGMVIDQRNAGASVTISSDVYTLDRWRGYQTVASKFSVQQNAGSVTPPAGFKNYLGVTSLSSYSVSSGDYFLVNQVIEGYNIADLGWGTSSAATVTLSFWVRSSLTGTFGGALLNQSFNRTYPFTYTISSANTWTQISVTITGETSGTWGSTNDSGMQVRFVMGCGSARLASTPNAWVSAGYDGPTGSTSVVGTNGATWYVTGVQLEVGTTATTFDFRAYGQELALCQRYFWMQATGNDRTLGTGFYYATTEVDCCIQFPVTMRSAPSVYAASGTNYYTCFRSGGSDPFDSLSLQQASVTNCSVYNGSQASGTAGVAGNFSTNNASTYVGFSAEL